MYSAGRDSADRLAGGLEFYDEQVCKEDDVVIQNVEAREYAGNCAMA